MELLCNAARACLDTSGGVDSGWPPLPHGLESCVDSAALAGNVDNALEFMDMVLDWMRGGSVGGSSGGSVGTTADIALIENALVKIKNTYEAFWITYIKSLDNEKLYSEDVSSLREKPTARAIVSLVVFIARGTLYAFASACLGGRDIMLQTAADFPGVVRGMIMQFAKPIVCYNSAELLTALDALAFAWQDIEYTPDIDDYVFLLSLRFSMFLRTGLPASEYGDLQHHKTNGPKIGGKEYFPPSAMFVGYATARFEAFLNSSWRLVQHPPILGSPLPPADASKLELEMAYLLLEYASRGANSPSIREEFNKLFTDFSTWPGDQGAFIAAYPYKMLSISNVCKILHGRSMRRQLFELANEEKGPQIALAQAVADLLVSPQKPRGGERSRTTFAAEIAALCTFNALFKGKYGVSWMTEFLVTTKNHTEYVAHQASSLFPRIMYVGNTFELFFNNRRSETTSSVFMSLAMWLDVVRTAFDSRIPVNILSGESNAHKQAEAAATAVAIATVSRPQQPQLLSSIDIRELCYVVEKLDHTVFAVDTLWTDSAVVVRGRFTNGSQNETQMLLE